MAKKRKNPKSCGPGKKLVKFKARGVSFCASKKKKGGKRKGGGRSKAALKTSLKKTCRTVSAAKRAKMSGLCKWANR